MADFEQRKVWSDLRVGLISLISIVILIAGVTFTGGNKGLLLRKTSIVKAWLFDVGGLKTGCSVTMNGMIVGKVNDIAFVTDSVKSQIEVTMEVRSDFKDRIKSDSVPTVRTQGLLGDRYIDISVG